MAGPVTSVGPLSVNSASGSVMVQQPSARRMLPATWRTSQSGWGCSTASSQLHSFLISAAALPAAAKGLLSEHRGAWGHLNNRAPLNNHAPLHRPKSHQHSPAPCSLSRFLPPATSPRSSLCRPSSSTAPDEASRTAQNSSNMCQPTEIALALRSKSVAFMPSAADLEAASVAASTSDKELETKPLILGRAASDTV